MVVRADGILDRCPRGNQALFELPAKPRSTRRTLTHPLEELHDAALAMIGVEGGIFGRVAGSAELLAALAQTDKETT